VSQLTAETLRLKPKTRVDPQYRLGLLLTFAGYLGSSHSDRPLSCRSRNKPIDIQSDLVRVNSYILVDSHPSLNHDDFMSCFDRGVEKATLPLAPCNHPPRRCQHKCHLRQNPFGSVGRPSRVTILRIRSHLLCIPLFSSSSIYVLSTSHTPLLRLLSTNSVGAVPVLPTSQVTPGQSSPSAEHRRCIPRAPPLRSTQSTLPHCSFFFRSSGLFLSPAYSPRQSIVESIRS